MGGWEVGAYQAPHVDDNYLYRNGVSKFGGTANELNTCFVFRKVEPCFHKHIIFSLLLFYVEVSCSGAAELAIALRTARRMAQGNMC